MTHGHFNDLNVAQNESLSILIEESGEAQQILGKIMRHGLDSLNPDQQHPDFGKSNDALLTKEIGDVMFAIKLLYYLGIISEQGVNARVIEKARKIDKYLHHKGTRDAARLIAQGQSLVEMEKAKANLRDSAGERSLGKTIVLEWLSRFPGDSYRTEKALDSLESLINTAIVDTTKTSQVEPKPTDELISKLDRMATHIEGLDSGSGDAKVMREAIAALTNVSIDARRWRALINSDRLRLIGSSGFQRDSNHDPSNNNRHFGMEFWSKFGWAEPSPDHDLSKQILEEFVDASISRSDPDE